MFLRIDTIPTKKLVGMMVDTNFANNRTQELWQGFMPRRNEIQNALSNDLYSLQIYPDGFFKGFDANLMFEKWATKEVDSFENIPDGMKNLILETGIYAVFLYKGIASQAGPFFYNIHREWIPNSEYDLDSRPHFEILGDKYKNDDPESEEEVWIPVRKK